MLERAFLTLSTQPSQSNLTFNSTVWKDFLFLYPMRSNPEKYSIVPHPVTAVAMILYLKYKKEYMKLCKILIRHHPGTSA
jgi:hypothetical protein